MDERSRRRARCDDDDDDDDDTRDGDGARAPTTRDGARVGNALDAVIERNDLFAHPPSITRDYRVDEALKLRYCAPYDFDFVCGVKARWAGRRLCDLFASEFPMRPKEYYVKAHAMGRLCVEANGCARTNGGGDADDADERGARTRRRADARRRKPRATLHTQA